MKIIYSETREKMECIGIIRDFWIRNGFIMNY